MVVALSIPVANVAQLLGLGFTTIEVWRSTDEGNLYFEVTAASPTAATWTSDEAATLFRMGGTSLRFVIDGGDEETVNFSSTLTYWTPTQVVSRINEVVAGLASVDDGAVVLTSPTTGRASTIEITYNDAHDLGDGEYVPGKAARPELDEDVLLYGFSDPIGSTDDRYKWRFSDDGASPISSFSDRVFGLTAPVDADLMSVATALFIGLDGRAKQTTVIIVSDGNPRSIGGYLVGSDLPLSAVSDALGFLQVPLVRGVTIRVAIEGTAFVREITVPDEASFDLLEAMAAADDPFTVQRTLPFLNRRSL